MTMPRFRVQSFGFRMEVCLGPPELHNTLRLEARHEKASIAQGGGEKV